jgi:diadenosine tetraphosphate (Ap4A) HIT family hydrolase
MVIHEGRHWLANLRDNDQTLLGTTFVTLKHHRSEVSQLTFDENQEYIMIRNGLYQALHTSFEPRGINESSLMNNAFTANPDGTPVSAAHVHYHLKPRYGTKPIEFAGDTFVDPLPGQYLSIFKRHVPTLEVAVQIATTIRNNLPPLSYA